LNYRERDEQCDIDVVANDAREMTVSCGLSTSLAFGGNDAALVMRSITQGVL
jgi:3-oxoacyl-[acyl-carrier-protein] synthase II